MEAKSILLESNQTSQNQFYTSIISFGPSRSGTKHTLSLYLVGRTTFTSRQKHCMNSRLQHGKKCSKRAEGVVKRRSKHII